METYCEVHEDFFAFNKIPRILFVHKARYSRQDMQHSIQYVSSKATPSFRMLFISMFASQLQCKQEGFFSKLEGFVRGPRYFRRLLVKNLCLYIEKRCILDNRYNQTCLCCTYKLSEVVGAFSQCHRPFKLH